MGATTKLNIGKIPVSKGEYQECTTYQRLNQVTMLGSTYQSKIDGNTSAPAQMGADGAVENINTDKWLCIAVGNVSAAKKVVYNNETSKLESENVQGAIDEVNDNINFSKFGFAYRNDVPKTNWILLNDGNTTIGSIFKLKLSEYTGKRTPFTNIAEFVYNGDTIAFSKPLEPIDTIKYFIVVNAYTFEILERIEITPGMESFKVSNNGILIGCINNKSDEEIYINKSYASSRQTNVMLFSAVAKANDAAAKANDAAAKASVPSLFSKVIFIGDSVTAGQCVVSGVGSKLKSQYSYPSILGRMFGFEVVNTALSGINTKNFNINRFSLFEENKENTDACFIELGWNDRSWATSKEELDKEFNDNVLAYGDNYEHYVTENSIIGNYCQLLKKVLASRPNIVVFLVISFGMKDYPNKDITIYGIKKVAEWASDDVILLDMSNSELKPDAGDGIHFSPLGYAKKASYLANSIINLSNDENIKISKRLLKL